MLYHYTDRLSLADIRREGVIRAQPITLYRDLFGNGPNITTPPIVWLTINPILDGTVVAKMMAGGWPKSLIGDLCRVVLPDEYEPRGLAEWTELHGIDGEWWNCAVQTGMLAGSDYTTWRIHDADIVATDWLRTETLSGLSKAGTVWR